MHPIKFQLGVSFLENGTKVLTPFGRCGKIYAHDEDTAQAFNRLMSAILWLAALALAIVTGALYLRYLGADRALAIIPLTFVSLDAIRVGSLLWIFRRARTLRSRRFASERSNELTAALFGPVNLRRFLTALDALMVYGAVYNLVLGLPTLGVATMLACASHLGVYVAQISALELTTSDS